MNNFTKIVTDKFLDTVSTYQMLDNTQAVVVGFSGGADSVCLLHILNSFKDKFGYNLKAIHVNHGIRGDEAKRDEDFAKKFCSKQNIYFEAFRFNCIEDAKRNNESVEECGRRLRYTVFNSACEKNSKIATAHNANDNAETVIFNIARGTTVKGLSGIPFTRDNIIRPLLNCTRNEIEGYCRENNLDFVVDSTNLSVDYTRNKIRHKILPIIEEINPSFTDAFSSLSNNAGVVCDLLNKNTEELMAVSRKGEHIYDRQMLLNSHKAVVGEVLFKAFSEFSGKALDNKKVKALQQLLKDGGRIQLLGNAFAEVKKDYIRFYTVDNVIRTNFCSIDKLPFFAEFNNFSVFLEFFSNNSKIVHQNNSSDMIDYNTVVGNLVLRTRKAGDKFSLKRRNVTKSLKKLFNEENVPIETREKLPVISDDEGVVWVQGFGVTKRCSVTKDSDNIVLVRGKYNDREKYD